MLVWLIYLSHLLACFWFTVSMTAHEVYGEELYWLGVYDGGRAVRESVSVQYLYALYWALTTLTTVGYGDVTPCNDFERMYTLLALLIGALVFGYMVSTIGSLIAGMDRQAATVQERVDAVKEYTTWRKMPRQLAARVRNFYVYYYNHVPAFDETDILEGLTPQLRQEVTAFLLKETVGSMPLFEKLSDEFQTEVFPRLKPLAAGASELIIKRGDSPDRIYFLLKGEVEVMSPVVGDDQVVFVIVPGQYFGEALVLCRRAASKPQHTVTFSHLSLGAPLAFARPTAVVLIRPPLTRAGAA